MIDGANNISQELEALTRQIAEHPHDDALYLRRGMLYWSLGRHGAAISDYERAAAINHESAAVQALEMSRSVMDFFNHDLYNP
ncbi:MAG: hypothetical protein ACI30K_03345 [Muribaculaceae bacterium]